MDARNLYNPFINSVLELAKIGTAYQFQKIAPSIYVIWDYLTILDSFEVAGCPTLTETCGKFYPWRCFWWLRPDTSHWATTFTCYPRRAAIPPLNIEINSVKLRILIFYESGNFRNYHLNRLQSAISRHLKYWYMTCMRLGKRFFLEAGMFLHKVF